MTEAEWLGCADPLPKLEFLRDKSQRKLRLFACAYFRSAFDDVVCGEMKRAWRLVEAAERYADGIASKQELEAACREGQELPDLSAGDLNYHFMGVYAEAIASTDLYGPFVIATATDYECRTAPGAASAINADTAERRRLLLELIGNPFHPIKLNPAWLSSTVIGLAESIYADRSFEKMPILGDALEDAGCDNQEILRHCRSGQDHVRGCWVLDLVLGKE